MFSRLVFFILWSFHTRPDVLLFVLHKNTANILFVYDCPNECFSHVECSEGKSLSNSNFLLLPEYSKFFLRDVFAFCLTFLFHILQGKSSDIALKYCIRALPIAFTNISLTFLVRLGKSFLLARLVELVISRANRTLSLHVYLYPLFPFYSSSTVIIRHSLSPRFSCMAIINSMPTAMSLVLRKSLNSQLITVKEHTRVSIGPSLTVDFTSSFYVTCF
jgi:hypothetical protein